MPIDGGGIVGGDVIGGPLGGGREGVGGDVTGGPLGGGRYGMGGDVTGGSLGGGRYGMGADVTGRLLSEEMPTSGELNMLVGGGVAIGEVQNNPSMLSAASKWRVSSVSTLSDRVLRRASKVAERPAERMGWERTA